MRRTNRTQIPQTSILVGDGNQSLVASGAPTVGNAMNIANLQLGVLSADPSGTVAAGRYIPAGTTAANVRSIQVAQGTPFSATPQLASPFGHTHKPIVKSVALRAGFIRSVATYKYELPRYDLVYITGLSGLAVSTRYTLNVTIEGRRTDISHGHNREVLSVTVETPAVAPTNIADWVLQNIILEYNRLYSRNVADQGQQIFNGSVPTIALGIKTSGGSGTTIGTLTRNTAAFNVSRYTVGGSTVQHTYAPDVTMINSLHTAIGEVAGLSTATIENVGAVTPGSAATIDGALLVLFHEPLLAVYDDVASVTGRLRVGFGLNEVGEGTPPTFTQTRVADAFNGANTGRLARLYYEQRSRQRVFSLQNYVQNNEYPLLPPSYLDDDNNYTLTIIDHYDTGDVALGANTENTAQTVIALTASVADLDQDADTGFTVATDDSTTVSSLNATLGAWLASAANAFHPIEYKGQATSGTPFV